MPRAGCSSLRTEPLRFIGAVAQAEAPRRKPSRKYILDFHRVRLHAMKGHFVAFGITDASNLLTTRETVPAKERFQVERLGTEADLRGTGPF